MKQILITLSIALSLSGCASLNQAYSAYGQAELVAMQGADDNVIRTWATAACATPYSAIIRNPEIAPALQSLCIPNGAVASPVQLLQNLPQPKK